VIPEIRNSAGPVLPGRNFSAARKATQVLQPHLYMGERPDVDQCRRCGLPARNRRHPKPGMLVLVVHVRRRDLSTLYGMSIIQHAQELLIDEDPPASRAVSVSP
jgi:hypothetical protein